MHSSELPAIIQDSISSIEKNKKRRINKIILDDQYFNLELNLNHYQYKIVANDLVYSAIPYDTGRVYIEEAACFSLTRHSETQRYLRKHEPNIRIYMAVALLQLTGNEYDVNAPEVTAEYNKLFTYPLFGIQVIGRMMQHDTTGALSANLPAKFLYDVNIKTGNLGYIEEYIAFLKKMTNELPVMTNGFRTELIENSLTKLPGFIVTEQSIKEGLNNSKQKKSLEPVYNDGNVLLKSEVGETIKKIRKNYKSQSVHPKVLYRYFTNVLPVTNKHHINVVSDIHVMPADGELGSPLPFFNEPGNNFNLIAGDASDSLVSDQNVSGIYVIGNHDLSDVLINDVLDEHYESYRKSKWFQAIHRGELEWQLLPAGQNDVYSLIAENIAKRFPKMKVLNNEVTLHDGIRYVGLTIPIRFSDQKKEQQWIYDELSRLVGSDSTTPTIIISHAPLFNELSLLYLSGSAGSDKKYYLQNKRLYKLFIEFNIIGVIHGHHHIPAAHSKWYTITNVFDKEMFVVDSIYASNNIGQELLFLIDVVQLRRKNNSV